jgi:ornithine cyclodeaminase/alanine dehydrogenase-like protein (mu-crystallin family)
MALFLTEADVSQLLNMQDALEAVEGVFKAQAAGEATNQPRRRVRARGAVLNVMSGAVSATGHLGLKAYTVARGKAHFHLSLYDADSGELLAFMEADRLGQMRTGAASGVATKYLSRPNSHVVGVYGTGWQAQTQLEAIAGVREIDLVKVYSRSEANRSRFCSEMKTRLKNVEVTAVDAPEKAATDVDIILTITSSRDPVLSGAWIRPGTHINAAGSNSLLRREIDDEVVKRASMIVVDDLDQARIEAGELLSPVEKGIIVWERVHALREVIGGGLKARQNDDQITLFKSLGVGIEDIAVAGIVYRRAVQSGLGKEF